MRPLHIYVLPALVCLGKAEVVTITEMAAAPSDSPQWTHQSAFTSAILNSTNVYRKQQNSSAVSWNKTLEDYARNYASYGSSCELVHSGGPFGENLAIGYANATASVEAWGNERKDYDFQYGRFKEKTGHFSQLVWRDTTDVGCARRDCGDKGWYLVCEYWPRGNVDGEYDKEVLKGIGFSYRPRPDLVFASIVLAMFGVDLVS